MIECVIGPDIVHVGYLNKDVYKCKHLLKYL